MLVGDVVLVGDERNVSSLLLALRLDLTALPPSPLPAARTASIPNRREHLAQQRAVEDSWYACHAPESPEKDCSVRGSPRARLGAWLAWARNSIIQASPIQALLPR